MTSWLRRIRGAVGMGLAWALGWGFVGGMIELASNLGFNPSWVSRIDMWPQTLAIPGFLAGAVFSIVLRIAGGHRRFDELSIPGFAAWGAVAGALLGGVAVAAGFLGPVFPQLWLRAAVTMTPLAVLCAASASGTLAIARKAEQHTLGAGAVRQELSEGEAGPRG